MSHSGPRRVAIACQGGGSHTAFTAGVLKRILTAQAEDNALLDDAEIVALSGTSGGAICALLAWDGLLRGEPERGVEQLESFWRRNEASGPVWALLNAWVQTTLWLRTFLTFPSASPYALPAWGQGELKAMLLQSINFEDVRQRAQAPEAPGLLIGAVEVCSGHFEVFRGPDLTVECVLASTALPTLFPAVEVPGRGVYWDGLFSQNPPVRELTEYRPDELWVIQINPPKALRAPRTVAAIADRRNELAGNLSLEQELRFVARVNDWLKAGLLTGPGGEAKYRPIDVYRICMLRDLSHESKLDRSPAFLRSLVAYGEAEADRFLAARRSSPQAFRGRPGPPRPAARARGRSGV
jgi:NTE family protein